MNRNPTAYEQMLLMQQQQGLMQPGGQHPFNQAPLGNAQPAPMGGFSVPGMTPEPMSGPEAPAGQAPPPAPPGGALGSAGALDPTAQVVDPRRAAWAGALSEIGRIAMGQAPGNSVASYYSMAANLNRQALRDARNDERYRAEQDWRRQRTGVADERYADETGYARGRDAILDERAGRGEARADAGVQIAQRRAQLEALQYRRDQELDPLRRRQLELGLDKAQAEVDALSRGGLPTKDLLGEANTLRDDYRTDAKSEAEALSAAQKGLEGAQVYLRPSYEGQSDDAWSADRALADKTSIISLAKIYDPGSVVSTAEGENIKRTENLPDFIWNLWGQVTTGESMNNDQRRSIVRIMRQRADSSAASLGELQDRYGRMAAGVGLDPSQVYGNIGTYGSDDLYQWLERSETPNPVESAVGGVISPPAASGNNDGWSIERE